MKSLPISGLTFLSRQELDSKGWQWLPNMAHSAATGARSQPQRAKRKLLVRCVSLSNSTLGKDPLRVWTCEKVPFYLLLFGCAGSSLCACGSTQPCCHMTQKWRLLMAMASVRPISPLLHCITASWQVKGAFWFAMHFFSFSLLWSIWMPVWTDKHRGLKCLVGMYTDCCGCMSVSVEWHAGFRRGFLKRCFISLSAFHGNWIRHMQAQIGFVHDSLPRRHGFLPGLHACSFSVLLFLSEWKSRTKKKAGVLLWQLLKKQELPNLSYLAKLQRF